MLYRDNGKQGFPSKRDVIVHEQTKMFRIEDIYYTYGKTFARFPFQLL